MPGSATWRCRSFRHASLMRTRRRRGSKYAPPCLTGKIDYCPSAKLPMLDPGVLLGGRVDVNITLAENAARRVLEGSGDDVCNKSRLPSGIAPGKNIPRDYSLTISCFSFSGWQGKVTGFETSEIASFAEADIPRNLFLGRVLPILIERVFIHRLDPQWDLGEQRHRCKKIIPQCSKTPLTFRCARARVPRQHNVISRSEVMNNV